MHIDDSEKEGRTEALKKLLGLMGGETGKKLGAIKRQGAPGQGAPAAAKHETGTLGGTGGPGQGAPMRAKHQADDLAGPGQPGAQADSPDQGGYCPHCGAAKGRG